jgi:hypothetical protein
VFFFLDFFPFLLILFLALVVFFDIVILVSIVFLRLVVFFDNPVFYIEVLFLDLLLLLLDRLTGSLPLLP